MVCGTVIAGLMMTPLRPSPDVEMRVEAWMMENPEVLIASLTEYQRQQDAAQKAVESREMQERITALENRLFDTGYSLEMGNPSGDVTMVLFSDYNCPHCATAQGIVKEVLAEDPGVRLILREYPVLGESSQMAARFALAVQLMEGRDRGIEVHDALFGVSGQISEDHLKGISADLGMSYPKIRALMGAEEVTGMIEANLELGAGLELRGTPNFVLANGAIAGAAPAENLLEAVAMQRSSK